MKVLQNLLEIANNGQNGKALAERDQFSSRQENTHSALALSLFQNRQQFKSQQLQQTVRQQQRSQEQLPPQQQLQQTVLQQQLSHEQFLDKNRHRLFAQFKIQPQQDHLSFNSLGRNFQTEF